MVTTTPPSSLYRGVSPPAVGARSGKRRRVEGPRDEASTTSSTSPHAGRSTETAFPTPAAVEAGKASVRDHLGYFTDLLSRCSHHGAISGAKSDGTSAGLEGPSNRKSTAPPLDCKRLLVEDYRNLYLRNANNRFGHHFVIHQHDHPRSGTHYDLRLQINEDSSCSWAVPYGMPGNPNEHRHGRRQAIETRIHSLWNHLIETASHKTGSMLIWDTGEYEVLPFDEPRERMTDDELSGASADEDGLQWMVSDGVSESEKLSTAFRAGKIRLRLHGSRLPPGYTVSIRLSQNAKQKISGRQDSRRSPWRVVKPRKKRRQRSPHTSNEELANDNANLDSDAENDPEYTAVRLNNAYPGARNTVDSIHQRWWFVAIDKAACGFQKGKDDQGHVLWTPKDNATKLRYPFYVRGRDFETSIVTGRKAADVLEDEGVDNYMHRRGWQPILS